MDTKQTARRRVGSDALPTPGDANPLPSKDLCTVNAGGPLVSVSVRRGVVDIGQQNVARMSYMAGCCPASAGLQVPTGAPLEAGDLAGSQNGLNPAVTPAMKNNSIFTIGMMETSWNMALAR